MDGVELLKHPKIISWSEFIEKGNSVDDETVQELCRQIQSEDTSSLIYTSGTTGNPKVLSYPMVIGPLSWIR